MLSNAENELSQIILNAINDANYIAEGAPFKPLLIKFAEPKDFVNIWTSERGDTPIAFYQFKGRGDGFCPLGDQAVLNGGGWADVPVLLFKVMPGFEDALVNPSGFTWILDDKGSGNDNNIVYWWPTAPDGYTAVGIAMSDSDAPPSTKNYWCVKNIYLEPVGTKGWWGDGGSNWTSHNGDLSIPVLNTTKQLPEEEQLLLAPTTLLSDEWTGDNNGNTNSYALLLGKCLLPVKGIDVPTPVYKSDTTQGDVTDQGLGKVAVIPCISVKDNRTPASSPFYYLAAQPFYCCTGSYSTPGGGTYQQSLEIGTSQEESTTVQNATSLTIGAEVGVEAGPVSASISVSYTQDMSVTTQQTAGSQTQVTTELNINIPSASVTQFWQRFVGIRFYRTDGSLLCNAEYGARDTRFTQSPT